MQAATQTQGQGSEAEIIKRHDRLIRYRAIPFVGHGVSLEDLQQEGRMALLEAARKFDASRGAALWTYARKFVLGAMIKLVTEEVNEPSHNSLSLGEGEDEEGYSVDRVAADEPSPEAAVEASEDLAILCEEIESLSNDERALLWQIFGENKSLRDVASEQECHHCGPQRVFRGALDKLRERMEARA